MYRIRTTQFIHECERLWKKSVNKDKVEVLPAPEGQEGTRVHKLLENLLKNIDDEYLLQFPNPIDILNMMNSPDAVETNIEEEYIIRDFPLEIVAHPDINIIFKDKSVNIIDTKTGFWARPDDPLYIKQTEVYAYIFLREGRPVNTFIYKPTIAKLFNVEHLDEMSRISIKAWMSERAERIMKVVSSKKKPKTNPGVDCKYCPYSVSCPDNPFSDIEKDPVKYLSEIIKRDATLSQMKKIAREHIKKSRPLDPYYIINGTFIGFDIQDINNVDKELYIKACKKEKIEPAWSVDLIKFRKQAKLYDSVANCNNITQNLKWKIRKASPEEEE